MPEELLATRVGGLLRSTNEVESVVKVLEASRQTMKVTKETVGTAMLKASQLAPSSLTLLTYTLRTLRAEKSADTKAAEALDQVLTLLETLKKDVPALVQTLTQAEADLDRLVGRYVSFGDALANQVGTTVRGLKSKITALQERLDLGDEPSPDLWRDYSKIVVRTADQVFAEYLDLLGGVSIRERGLVIQTLGEVCPLDELCTMADWHVNSELRQCVDWAQPAFTLPGRESLVPLRSWPIMQLGFAHWSIWGMPLEGHEFGRVVASQADAELREWEEELAAFGVQGLRMLVADIIGAWAEGPAYACALCFLVLDPAQQVGESGCGHITSADRAEVVDTCLRQQIVIPQRGRPALAPEEADLGYAYLPFVSHIRQRWDHVLKTTGQPRSDRTLLRGLPKKVWQALELKRPFQLTDWRTAKNVWSALQQGKAPPADPPVGIRHLMNAAWYARCSPEIEMMKSSRLEPDEIERRALRAGQDIANPKPFNPGKPDQFTDGLKHERRRQGVQG
jgi:hypothetical protein